MLWLSELFVGLLAAVWAILASTSTAQEVDPRIVGGSVVSISNFRYQMQVLEDNSFICGGSLVRPTFVVTAAHCATGKVAGYKVRGGAEQIGGTGGVTRQVQRIFRPSAYNARTMNFDVAMFQLKAAMAGANIAIIPLCTAAVPNGANVLISGWGAISESSGSSLKLRSTQVSKVAFAKCNNMYSSELTATMMCAAKSGKDSCFGDSGGPLVYNSQLCGIVSWGNGCARQAYPGVYTDVLKVRAFINNVISTYSG